MIEITNTKKQGELPLGFKGKDGKAISFTYGKTLDETMVDGEILKNALDKGLLSAYLSKGWIVRGKVNVNNKIIGTPETFRGITSNEAGQAVEIKAKQQVAQQGDARGATDAPAIFPTQNTDGSIGDVQNVPRKRGRPAKVVVTATDIPAVSTPAPIIQATEAGTPPPAVTTAEVVAPATAEPKKEDDFV
jgi:hypothetical protein